MTTIDPILKRIHSTSGKDLFEFPGVEEACASRGLRARGKLRAKNAGDRDSAIESAGSYAQKQKKTMFVYAGTSYGHGVWRVTPKSSEYNNRINNTGGVMYSVSPDLEIRRHDRLDTRVSEIVADAEARRAQTPEEIAAMYEEIAKNRSANYDDE